LGFLTEDLAKQPERIKTLSSEWVERIQSLVSGVEVDFDTPLSAAEE
jgi:antitoxin PrlF